jgi:hypothetical protein
MKTLIVGRDPLKSAKIILFFVMKFRLAINKYKGQNMIDAVIKPEFNIYVSDIPLAFSNIPDNPDHLKICIATCRPYCTIWHEGVLMDWQDYIKCVEPKSESIKFSIYKLFGKFVKQFEYYPTLIDFAHWLYYTNVMHKSKHTTLPKYCLKFINIVFKDYSEVIKFISPKEFIVRINASIHIVDRKRIEKNGV